MKLSTRRVSALTASVAALALVVSACGSGTSSSKKDEGTPVKGGTLNMLGVGDVDYLDPNVAYYTTSYTALRMVSRQLFTFPAEEGKTTTATPDLAEDMPKISDDGKTYTIKLRPGVKWNAATPREVTADDVVRGVKRTCNSIQPFGGLTNYVDLVEGMSAFCSGFEKVAQTPAAVEKYINDTKLPGVEATDASTVVFHLTGPASYFTDMLTLPAFSPAPVESLKFEPGSAEYGKNLISDGPYKIDSYEPTKSMELSRNPNWDSATDPIRKAYVDKISVNMTGEQANIQQQLETGSPNADMEWDTFPPPTEVPRLLAKKDPNLNIGDTSSSNPYIVYNFESPNNGGAMAKKEFRQALSYGINRDNILQVLGGKDLNKPLTHVLPEGILGSKPNDPYPYSESKAKELLSQAGQASPTIKLLYRNESQGSTKAFQTVQADLAKVGVKVEGVSASNADFYTKYLQKPDQQARKGTWDLAIAGWGSDWYGNAAASFFLPLYYGKPSFPPTGSNFGLYDNTALNAKIKEAAASQDNFESLWAEADKMVMDDAAFYPITNPKQANYHASQVHNAVYMEAYQNFDPTNVWLDKDKQG